MRLHVPPHAVAVDGEVAFHDVDMLRVAWHGHYAKYVEHARTALQRATKLDVPDLAALHTAWLVVDYSCRFVFPLRYGDTWRVRAWFTEWEARIGIDYEIQNLTQSRRAGRARTVLVSTDAHGELLFQTPDAVAERIRAHVGAAT